jgi:UDP-N-acetylglucosamine 2-epimerase
MLERLEAVMRDESPDRVVVFGDTNSTLAGALAAAKLGMPLAHVEAGLRSFNRAMPEEINRVVTDHCADLLFCPTESAVENATDEGLGDRSFLTGDIMYDSLLRQLPRAKDRSHVLDRLAVRPGEFVLATVHRPSNTDDQGALGGILDALSMLDTTVIFPVHPRTRLALARGDLETPAQVRAIDPVGYVDMLVLEEAAAVVLTDSGGMQKEAYLLGTPCVTLRDETEWPETLTAGWNVLAGNNARHILEAAQRPRPEGATPPVFGDGKSAERMVELLSHDPPHSRCVE